MKVLMTTDTLGGVWTYTLELIRALGPAGVEVVLATMGAPLTPLQWEHSKALDNLKVHESGFRLEWMPSPWLHVQRGGDWLLELEAQVKPDAVHLNNYVHGALPWRAPALIVGHACVLSWWHAVKGEPTPAAWNRYRQEVARGLQGAALVVTSTHTMLDALQHHYGPLSHTRVIPNGYDSKPFSIHRKENFVFAAGRLWDEARNLRTLDKAAAHLDWPVYAADEGHDPDGHEARARHMHSIGRLNSQELQRWLARAAVYALPARYEPVGLSVLEAALAGCALVLGDIPSLREVWDGAARFVPPTDAYALSRTLRELMADPPQRMDWAARARERARQFTPERFAASYLAAYRAVRAPRIRPLITLRPPAWSIRTWHRTKSKDPT